MSLDVEQTRMKLFSLAAEVFGESAWVDERPARALSSIDLMRFVLKLEQRFDIEVADEDLGAENFTSMAVVVELIQRSSLRRG
jgi:acyl carrier protein